MHRHRKMLLIGLIALTLGFIFLQVWQDTQTIKQNPPIQQEPEWDSECTRALVERACFDCHSNETAWPWYAQLSPMSLMIQQDVLAGRQALNFSEWDPACCTQTEIDALAEVVGKDRMPLPYYLILHPEAQLSSTEEGELVYGLIATMEQE